MTESPEQTATAAPAFVHLRVHSDFSMIDGLHKVNAICEASAKLGMPALALTDQMNLCGLVRFYRSSHKLGLKPIIGCDLWVLDADEPDEGLTRLTVLAMNNNGYQQLTQLISRGYLAGHRHGRACIDRHWLAQHNDGLILLSGGRDGQIGRKLLQHKQAEVMALVEFYQQYFSDRFYLELTRTGRPQENDYIHAAVMLAGETGLPVVATNEVVFLQPSEFHAHEIRVAVSDGYTLDDKRRPKLYSEQQYLRSSEQMCELFADLPEALENTVEIAKRCNVTVTLDEYVLPEFPTGGMTPEEFLVVKSQQGLEQRLQQLFPEPQQRQQQRGEYDQRLAIELGVINDMGFAGYFLIVMEFIQWSKDNNIPVGPGRGSGAGSLVAYALKITDLDPLQFDLLFERFLNPERVSMPDFDIDFCMDRRDEVIDHVAELYGREAVSQIITFGTMAAKAAIRDVGRVLGHPYGFVDKLTKLVPNDPGMTLEKAFEVEPRLQEMYEQDEDVRDLIDMARTLEGCTRNAGKHAGGVVIAPTKITDFSPLYCDEEGKQPVTQFDKNDVEAAGLVKFDFLGLRTLTIIQWALEMVNQQRQQQQLPAIAIESIPLDDPDCFKLLKKGQTTAVFQLESAGMKQLIKKLLPDTFEDIIALVALFRPGPLQSGMVDNFIDRKHGREVLSYPDKDYQHASLKPILEPTYGVILYQEQVMQIAQVLAGYSLGEADLLRRAMGKKKPEEMAKQRAVFEQGAKQNNIDPELAVKIFDLVEKFAGYGFNKSHSAAYALVSYQTLWLKTHYPAEFMAAVMSADMDNTDKIVTLVDECEQLGLRLLPPDINKGQYKFTVADDGTIIYGIGAIKGVGAGPIEAILQARQDGIFSDLYDFCARVDLKRLNRRILEKLIKAGALDSFGIHRAGLFANLEQAMRQAEQTARAAEVGQSDLFGMFADPVNTASKPVYQQVAPWSEAVWLEFERETLGLYLTGHPINRYRRELRNYVPCVLADVKPTARDQVTTVAGLIIDVRTMVNKKGSRWAIVTLDDKTARFQVRFYSQEYDLHYDLLQNDQIIVVKGEVSFDDFAGANTMTAREVNTLLGVREQYAKGLLLQLRQEQLQGNGLARLQALLQAHQHGTTPVRIHYQRDDVQAEYKLGTAWCVTPADELLHELAVQFGDKHVVLEF